MPTFENHEKLGVVRALLNGNGMPKNELRGAREPTPNDDLGQGWEIGSRWFFRNREWVCKSAAYGFAVWDLATGDAGVQAQLPPYTPFSSVAEIGVTSVPADLPQITAVINGLSIAWGRDPSGTLMSADGATWSPLGDVYPEHFGAVGDGSTDDTAACQAWVDFLRGNGRSGRMSGRTYVVTSLQMMPQKFYSITGDNFHLSEFLIRNYERTGVGLNFGHVDENTRPPFGVRLDSIRVRAGSGSKACLIQFARNIDLQVFRLKVTCFHGATGIRAYGLWNCDFKEVTVYGGGHNIPSKVVPLEARFSIADGGTTLTSNVDVFSAADVNANLTVVNSSQGAGQRHTITGYTGPRTVTVSVAQAGGAQTAGLGSFGGIRGMTTAGSNILTLGRAIDADDVGRVVYIVGAGQISGVTGPVPHRARIVSVSGNLATLDSNVPVAVTWSDLVFDPAVDLGEPNAAALDQKTNDASFQDLHVELHRGCGMVLYGVRVSFERLKLHGYNMNGTTGHNDMATNIQALIYDTNAQMNGAFEQTVCGNTARVLFNSVKGINVSYAETLGINRLPLFQQWVSSRSPVDVGTITFYGNSVDAVFDGMIGPGWFNQYGYTTSSERPGVAKKHGTPITTFP